MSFLDDLTRDLRYAARSFRREPAFVAGVVLTFGPRDRYERGDVRSRPAPHAGGAARASRTPSAWCASD
jgi:hypothetical protein